MIEQQDPKKKKRGLVSMEEKMGLDEGSDYMTPPSKGIVPTPEQSLNEKDQQQTVGSRLRDRMTGRV